MMPMGQLGSEMRKWRSLGSVSFFSSCVNARELELLSSSKRYRLRRGGMSGVFAIISSEEHLKIASCRCSTFTADIKVSTR